MPLAEARRNDELITLASSQVLRWLDELNGVTDADQRTRELKAAIRALRKEPSSLQNRKEIRRLYDEMDSVQFVPDYLCVVMDKKKDYLAACKGFTVNGIKYHRLLGTNGGVKNETIVFISDKNGDEIRRRIENGRDPTKELVPAKLEAYKALTCSASTPVSMPRGVLIVSDCETQFLSDVIYLSDEEDEEPVMEHRSNVLVDLDESDGYGIMLPSLADRWAEELRINYRPSGINTRFAWEKGMVFCFDFRDFAEKVAENYLVKDAWGVERDVRDVELILTTSMVKLWDSYGSCEEYLSNCLKHGYTFGITKVCPRSLESVRDLNYQFIQSYDLSDEDIEELIEPTMTEIRDVLGGDFRRTILFLKGVGLEEDDAETLESDIAKAIMVEPAMLDDPYIQSRIYQAIRNRINEAKVGVIRVHGNYSMVSGDPYSLCQSVFGLPVTGLLKAGEIYNEYWAERDAEKLACFRAPMTASNNIVPAAVNRTDDARYWYRDMKTCTVFNSWDTSAMAMNGMDKDGDMVMLTDNRVLVDNLTLQPAIMCIQRRAEKKVVTEEDLIEANINSFGDDIGKITNRITAMFEQQSYFEKGEREYGELAYRIRCGQLYQQNSIDRAKGIISKPMPREWHDRHHALAIEDPEKKELYLSILADKKPYFMKYIYPDLMKQYNTYIKNTEKKCQREFSMSIAELLERERDYPEELGEEQVEFLNYYRRCMPVGTGDCVINRICRRFEEEFDGHIGKHNSKTDFDYSIMKSGAEYSRSQYEAIRKLYDEFNRRNQSYAVYAARERVDKDEAQAQMYLMQTEFRAACDRICPSGQSLCDIILDICYRKSSTKSFAWNMCADEIIANLLTRSGNRINIPVADPDGEVEYNGKKFRVIVKEIGKIA